MTNKFQVIIGVIIIVLAIFGTVTIKWQFDKNLITLYRDDNVIAKEKWVIHSERTFIVKDSWYDRNVKCPKIIDMGGHETATRCYYPDMWFEPLKRSLIKTNINYINSSNEFTVIKKTPNYMYGTRGAYAGYLVEKFIFDKEINKEEEFPKEYTINWSPKDTRNYKLEWRLYNLEHNYQDGNYTKCAYNFGYVYINLKNNCHQLDYVEIKDDKVSFWFNNKRGDQFFDIDFYDPSAPTWIHNISNTSVESGSGTTTYLTNLSDYVSDVDNDTIYFSVQDENTSQVDCSVISIGWISDDSRVTGLGDVGSYSTPSIAFNVTGDNTWTLISGESYGAFSGFYWNGTQWVNDSSRVTGLGDASGSPTPSIAFNITGDNTWTLISGAGSGTFSGFYWNGTQWVNDSSRVTGLGDVGTRSTPSIAFNITGDNTWTLISGEHLGAGSGTFSGFYWNGTQWVNDSSRVTGLGDVGSASAPSIVFNVTGDNTWTLISGKHAGTFNGFYYNNFISLTLTPYVNYLGNATCTIGVKDSSDLWGENRTFYINVTENSPIWIYNISNTTIVEDSGTTAYLLNLSDYVNDSDGDTVIFSIQDENTSEVDCRVYIATEKCYQESANVSTACGGLATGTYANNSWWVSAENVTDGNWSTYGRDIYNDGQYAKVWINYTKPSAATNNSLWQVKATTGASANQNHSILANCWAQSPLQFEIESSIVFGGISSAWLRCYNGTDFEEIYETVPPNDHYIYEEAMWWDIVNDSVLDITPSANWAGNATCTVGINDSVLWGENRTFGIEVTGVNDPPYFVEDLTNQSTNTSVDYFTYDVNCSDVDGDNVSYYSNTSWVTISSCLWCYQETANVSTSCGGLSTGSYTSTGSFYPGHEFIYGHDGNWTTYMMANLSSTATVFVNYSKVSNSLSTSYWQIKDSDDMSKKNLTINSTCWEQDPLQFKLFLYMDPGVGLDYVDYHCYNGTEWLLMRNATMSGSSASYEEAMWWNLNSPGLINFTPHEQYTGITLVNITCSDGTINVTQTFYMEVNDTTAPTYISSEIENSTRTFCEETKTNATCSDYSFTDTSSIYYSDNHTGSWVNYTALYFSNDSINYTFYYDIKANLPKAGQNTSYRFFCIDDYNNTNSSMSIAQFNTTKHSSVVTLYLNDLNASRKYELTTIAKLNGTLNSCTNETLYMSIDDYGYGDNYSNSNNSEVLVNYTKNVTTSEEFNDSSTYKYLSLYFTNHTYINMQGNAIVETTKFKIEGFNTSGSYPKNIKINVLNDTNDTDVILPNELRESYLWTNKFINNKTGENISFTIPETIVRYVNFTANSWLTGESPTHGFDFNFTMDLKGYNLDADIIDFNEDFLNSSYINSTNSVNATNTYYYDDYSKGEISGRWNGYQSTFGSHSPTIDEYTVTANQYIKNQISAGSDDSCSDVYNGVNSIDGGTTRYWFDDIDISDYNQISFQGYLYASGHGGCDCMASCRGSGIAKLGIRDNYGNYYSVKSLSAFGSASWGGWDTETKTDNSVWKIKKNGGYFLIYDDNTYVTEVEIVDGREYYIYGEAYGRANMQSLSSGSAYVKLYPISISGLRGEYLGTLQWGNASLVSTRILNATQGNISRALLTSTVSNSDGGSLLYWLSNDNMTTWESVQTGITHTFTSQGHQLFAKINLTTTNVDTPITVDSYDIDVVHGYISNLVVDVGYDGDIDYNYSGTINSSNPQLNVQIDSRDSGQYIGENCLNELTCKVPIAFKVSSAGTLGISNMTYKQNLSYLILNNTKIENNLSGISTKKDLIIAFESTQNGSINITDLVIQVKGDDNVTVNVTFYGNENYTSVSDVKYVSWRYSPISVSYPTGTTAYNVYPSTISDTEVSPSGQVIELTESESTSIWNITTTALTDPVKIYRWYDDSVDSCLTLYSCLYFNQTNCTTVTNATNTLLITDLNNTESTKLYDFWNLSSCPTASVYLSGSFTWKSLCFECVETW